MRAAIKVGALLCVLVLAAVSGAKEGVASRNRAAGLSSLPAAALVRISAAMGRDIPGYQLHWQGVNVRADNRAQRLTTSFTSHGIEVRSGSASSNMALRGYGYGDALTAAGAVFPASSRNRLEYRRGPMTEWYLNGPTGLEQGFTLAAPPRHVIHANMEPDPQPLTIALEISGNLTAAVENGGTSLTLANDAKQTVLRYAGLTAFDANGRELRAWMEMHDNQLLLKADDRGACYPLVIDPTIQQVKLTASDGVADGALGLSISSSGNTIVAGAPNETVGSNELQGAIYVFVKPATGWANLTQTAKLTTSDGMADDSLGYSVSISGNTVVAGAPGATIGSNQSEGAAYVFVEPIGGWVNGTQTAKLTPSDGTANGRFGTSTAISGGTVAIGAINSGTSGKGEGYVFVRPGPGWESITETAKLTSSDGFPGNEFGWSAATDASTIVIGAESLVNGEGDGVAYVYVKPAGGWITMAQTAELTPSDTGAVGLMSYSLAISGGTVVAGAPGSTVVYPNQGAVYVFVEPVGGWVSMTETAKLVASDAQTQDELGYSVAMSGNFVVAGAPFHSRFYQFQGAAYQFVKPQGGWVDSKQRAEVLATDGSYEAFLGFSVAINANSIAAGAPQFQGGAPGAVYVFSQKN